MTIKSQAEHREPSLEYGNYISDIYTFMASRHLTQPQDLESRRAGVHRGMS